MKRHMAHSHTNNKDNLSIMFPDTDMPDDGAIESDPNLDGMSSHSGDTLDTNDSTSLNLSILKDEAVPSLQTVEGCFFCPLCGLRYKRSGDLNRHMKQKHQTNIKLYLASCENADGFHDDSHFDDSTNQSRDDDYDDSLQMDDEDAGNHGNEDLRCHQCPYVAKWQSELERHLASHTTEKRYKCPNCNKQYKYLGDLNVHLRRDHRAKPGDFSHTKIATTSALHKNSPSMFKCPSCPFSSQWKSEIDRHSKSHTEGKPFCCNNCDYQSHWKGRQSFYDSSFVFKT